MRQFILVACLTIVSVSGKPGPGYTYSIPAGGGLAANLLPPSATISQQFARSHGSLGLSHSRNEASFSLGTSYSAESPNTHSHQNLNGHSHGGSLLSSATYIPSPSYGVPNKHVASQSFTPTVTIVAPSPSSSYGAPSSSSSFSVSAPSSYSSFSVGSAPSSSFGSHSSSSFDSFSSVAPLAEQTIVQKHIYVHVPPPDIEEQQIINQAPQPVSHQKHYKIIFIKAPSPPSIQEQLIKQQIAQQQQVNEEKTLVYVLVKKPEGLQELRQAAQNIQAPQTIQSKPEVYFIKYKAEKDASPSIGSLVGNLPFVGPSSVSSGNIDVSGLGISDILGASNLSGSSVIFSSSGHTGGNTYLPPVENPPPSAVHSGDGSSLSGSSVSEIIHPRTPAPEYGPPKH